MADDDSDLTQNASAYLRDGAQLARAQAAALGKPPPPGLYAKLARWAMQAGPFVLSIGTALIVFALLAIVVASAFAASRQRGLVVEAFSVPQSMIDRGLTGQVLASQLLDRIAYMQSRSVQKSHRNSLHVLPPDTPIKVEISSTTVTFDEIYTYFLSWFGRTTFVSGELFVSPGKDANKDKPAQLITLTARAEEGGRACTRTSSSLDFVLGEIAGCIYRSVQPYRYAAFMATLHDYKVAVPIFKEVIQTGSRDDRAWAYESLGYRIQMDAPGSGDPASLQSPRDRYVAAIANYRLAIFGTASSPGNQRFSFAYRDLADAEESLGHDEQAYQAKATLLLLTKKEPTPDLTEQAAASLQEEYRAGIDDELGFFLDAAGIHRRIADYSPNSDDSDTARSDYVEDLANLHDAGAANLLEGRDAATQIEVYTSLKRWTDVVALSGDALKACGTDCLAEVEVYPNLAEAQAMLDAGRKTGFADAERTIAATPLDCYACVRVRAEIADMDPKWGDPDAYFRQAVALAPSLPAAYDDWGSALLSGGRFAQSIPLFERASFLGPNFADPLEHLGEALIATGRSDLAVPDFARAAKLAPHWARLHFKWGEALYWLRRPDDAKAEFRTAMSLGLEAEECHALAWFLTQLKVAQACTPLRDPPRPPGD